ncbi:MAG: sigma-54-dependent transcriptional regulator [Gemmatimonadaceae bacterium]
MKTSRAVLSSFTPESGTIKRNPGIADIDEPGLAEILPESHSPAARSLAAIRVAIVDDDRTLREGCASVLRVEGYNVTAIGRGDEALEMLRRSRFDIMLVDVCMTPVSGLDILKAVMTIAPSTIVVLMTGNPSLSMSIEAMRVGAWDYLPKPYSGTQLQLLLGRAAHAVMKRQADETIADLPCSLRGPHGKIHIYGASPAFQRPIELARRVAPTTASVMIVGETGTGKELLAQLIHRTSRRASMPLVPVNCAAIPDQLLESEMFGHRKGSFTGADRDRVGLLEAADGATLFLDELAEMSLPLQAKMLRVVQDGVVRRVGSDEADSVVDVRFISATNRDPQQAIRDKKLREDLYYRLNVVQINLPPLRDRVDDIPMLANAFLKTFWGRHRSAREAAPTLSDDAIEVMSGRPWRGNVRELQNFMEYLAVTATPGSSLRVEDLPLDQQFESPASATSDTAVPLNAGYHASKEQVLAAFERSYVTRLVARASGNMSRAARLASVDRTTLYRLLERHGLRSDFDDMETPVGPGA